MTDASIARSYRAASNRVGKWCMFRRTIGEAPNATSVFARVRAQVTAFAPDETRGGALEGVRNVVVMADDFAGFGYPAPVRAGDTITVEATGEVLTVKKCDAETRALAGAYEITAVG